MKVVSSQRQSAQSFGKLMLLLAASTTLVTATPYPKDNLHDAGFSYLMPRGCNAYCGSDNQFCCGPNEACVTLAGNVASCTAGTGGRSGQYTTTWTETKTYTSTIGTFWPAPPQPTKGVDCVPQSSDQEQCGNICCAGWQYCAYKGQCLAKPGLEGGKTVTWTTNGVVTTQYSAPYRVTSTTTIVNSGVKPTSVTTTQTTSGTPTATSTQDPDANTGNPGGSGGNKLSGGAIAGIVIGVLVGISLLSLLCFCCIVRGIWHAIFGKKKEKETTVIEEDSYYSSRHGSRPPASAHSRRDRHSGWFGGGGGGPASAGDRREKKSEGKRWLGLAAGATTLLALLNMKKDKKPVRKGTSSRYTDSYYTYSDATTESSSSSGARTSRTRRSRDRESRGDRDSRGTRSQYTRSTRRP